MKFTADQSHSAADLVRNSSDQDAVLAIDANLDVHSVSPIDVVEQGGLCFSNDTYANTIAKYEVPDGCTVVVKRDPEHSLDGVRAGYSIVEAAKPRRWFIAAVRQMFLDAEKPAAGIHPSSYIEDGAEISNSAHIGPFVTIQKGACIGDKAVIHHGCFIGPETRVGRDAVICANSVVGMAGQAVERLDDDEQIMLPHLGHVIIGDGVRLGANCVVVRGSLQNTIVGRRTMVGNLSNIGHNVSVGEDCFIGAHTLIAGSAVIGDRTWLAPGVMIANKAKVGRNAMVGLNSGVTKFVREDDYVFGNPARSLRKINKYNK